jgi:hypothetical protein
MSVIFKETYDGESLYDVSRDIAEAFDEDYNKAISSVPKDEYGFHKGNFTITVEWSEEELN